MAQTYLYSYGNGPHGASPTRRDRAYIESREQFAKVHPVLMDRLFALCDRVIAAGGDYGFGGGWRSSLQQRNLFLSRYTRVQVAEFPAAAGTIYWDGSPSWPKDAGRYRHTSGAPSAPPGRSYHESTTNNGLGFALAVDMVGTHNIGNAMAESFGLKSFEDVNAEPWHYQPVEIPTARRNYRGEFENVSPPTTPGDDMAFLPADVRILDTRPLVQPVQPGQELKVALAEPMPAGMTRAAVNIVATDTRGNGFVTAWRGGARPNTSNVNYAAGQTVANLAFVPVAADNTITVSPATSSCHLVIDQQGWAA